MDSFLGQAASARRRRHGNVLSAAAPLAESDFGARRYDAGAGGQGRMVHLLRGRHRPSSSRTIRVATYMSDKIMVIERVRRKRNKRDRKTAGELHEGTPAFRAADRGMSWRQLKTKKSLCI